MKSYISAFLAGILFGISTVFLKIISTTQIYSIVSSKYLFIIIFLSAIGFVLTQIALKRKKSSHVNIIVISSTVIVSIIGGLFLGETITILGIIGILFIISSIFILLFSKKDGF